MASQANPLNQLLEAENDVSRLISSAEQEARTKVQRAEIDADREYERLKTQEEDIFAKEQQQVAGKGDASVQETIADIEKKKAQQQQSFDAAQEQVVQLMLHQVTTCAIQLTEQQRQAFLAVQRAKIQAQQPQEY